MHAREANTNQARMGKEGGKGKIGRQGDWELTDPMGADHSVVFCVPSRSGFLLVRLRFSNLAPGLVAPSGLEEDDEEWRMGSGEVVEAGVWMRWTG